jgi:hypothetical protein
MLVARRHIKGHGSGKEELKFVWLQINLVEAFLHM